MKERPKSCHCFMCRWVKAGEKRQPGLREMEEKAFRRSQKQALAAGRWESVVPAPRGDYHA